jgi:hypothetical protein
VRAVSETRPAQRFVRVGPPKLQRIFPDPTTSTLGVAHRMSTFVRNFTIALVALTVVTGIFVEPVLSFAGARIPNTTELRWSLMLGMPIILVLSYAWLNRQPATTRLAAALHSLGLLALFIAPYGWVVGHAQ